MNPETQLQHMLFDYCFDLVRQKKHRVYRNPDGLTFVTASTPSDVRAAQNTLSDFKRYLRQNGKLELVRESSPTLSKPQPKRDRAPQIIVAQSFPDIEAPTMEAPPVVQPASALQTWQDFKQEYAQAEEAERFQAALQHVFDRFNCRVLAATVPKRDALEHFEHPVRWGTLRFFLSEETD